MKKLLLMAIMFVGLVNVQAQEEEWTKKYYVDDFGDKTTEGYAFKVFSGTFSNSATTNSLCLYTWAIKANGPTLLIYEYGSSRVTSYRTVSYKVRLKNEKGDILEVIAHIYENRDRLQFYPKKGEKIIEFLKKSSIVKVYIKESGSYTSYKGEFSCVGFTKAYNSL